MGGMARGRLHIFLGAAPGAGKTFAMLEEGQRLRRDGVDVVVGAASVRGRSETAALLEGLERCPAPSAGLGESDLDAGAVLERAPAVVLVDDYATAAGSAGRGRARWQDVALLLDAGIDVVSTLDVRNIESLSDVVQGITGSGDHETVPDVAVRAAEQIELVDAPPEVLRDRLGQGKIYGTRQRVDAALAGDFRTESLAALRELALVWLADRVEERLVGYRSAEGKDALPKREKIVVGLSGGPEGAALVRRAARLLAGSAGGEFDVVHVRRSSGDDRPAATELERLRKLTNDLGGGFHVVGGEDVPEVLLQFALNGGASQILLGSRWARPYDVGRGTVARILRHAAGLDVHLVPHEGAAAGPPPVRKPSRLGRRREAVGFVMAVVLPPVLQLVLDLLPHDQLSTDMLVQLTGIVAVALVGGLRPAVLAAVLAGLVVNYFSVRPFGSLSVIDAENVLALVVFLLVAVAVSLVVDRSARRSRQAHLASAEARILGDLSRRAVIEGSGVPAFLDQVREHFRVEGAGLWVRDGTEPGTSAWRLESFSGTPGSGVPEDAEAVERLDEERTLTLSGRVLDQDERRLLSAFGAHLLALLQREELTLSQRENLRLAEGNTIRTSILRAVSHDLRTPLAGIKLASSSLRNRSVVFTPAEQEEFLATIESGADRLDRLIGNLLDMSRITADSVSPLIGPVYWSDAVADALREADPDRVRILLPYNMPPVDADPGMLDRVIANLVENALKYAPESEVVVAGSVGGYGNARIGDLPASELRIIDHGPGIASEDVLAMFRPFQRASDTTPQTGIGLGLAVAKGFTEAMGGALIAEPTPGGGLTMVVRLPLSAGSTAQNR
ncbi:sensor histidine kinase KdpD [Arthrobacter ginkgonis]|uniref:histidine kinase n=1 Tax=Arthrobacter ginkgonis TaxID=1630594 RepID=A0ABP7CEQ1_9MICC